MSIEKKSKDHLKEHGGVALVSPVLPQSDDPLKFWTNHPTENILVDLQPFVDGEFENQHPSGGNSGFWAGPYTGRPKLIAELAPLLQARFAMLTQGTVGQYLTALRAWWRFFDSIEASRPLGGQSIARVTSVADLHELHEAAANLYGISMGNFNFFRGIADAARKLQRLPALLWKAPKRAAPLRKLPPDDQVREIRTAIKQDWERVRHTWARNDDIRFEAARRAAGEDPVDLDEEDERLLRNWQHAHAIQLQTGLTLPSAEQLHGWWVSDRSLSIRGLEIGLMRSLQFPTAEEADIAFHLALMNSGWNPSTLANIDATAPFLIADHPKDGRQLVLKTDEGGEDVTMHAGKPRARGKTQFCTGKKSQPSSAPMVVGAYLSRVGPLREILQQEYQVANAELASMQAAGETQGAIARQVKRVQTLQAGCRSVWLFVNLGGRVRWVGSKTNWKKYRNPDNRLESYLDRVRHRLNARRAELGRPAIANITPSDFRDIFARWVYVASGGNILAVALALGHSSLSSTAKYLENNIFSAENDEHARCFMTHLFAELERGRVDLTILAQLVRHGPLTPEMEAKLLEYRQLMRSRIGVGCADPRHPPGHVAPGHVAGRLCGTHRCLKDCPHAKFLPDSLSGIAMRVEELQVMSDHLPRETWLRGEFQLELDEGEALLADLYPPTAVTEARDNWRRRIVAGEHPIPGLGLMHALEEVA